jgi:hypothetical protein
MRSVFDRPVSPRNPARIAAALPSERRDLPHDSVSRGAVTELAEAKPLLGAFLSTGRTIAQGPAQDFPWRSDCSAELREFSDAGFAFIDVFMAIPTNTRLLHGHPGMLAV